MQTKERKELIRLLETLNIKTNDIYLHECIYCNSKYKDEDQESFVFLKKKLTLFTCHKCKEKVSFFGDKLEQSLDSIEHLNEKYLLKDRVWKDIIGYEGRYKISSKGDLVSLERYININSNRPITKTPFKFINGRVAKDGYIRVTLMNNEGSQKVILLSHVIYKAFYPNVKLNNDTIIGYKDSDILNNSIDNLYIVENEDNQFKPNRGYSMQRKVICVTTGKEFDSATKAGKFYGTTSDNILRCCNKGEGYSTNSIMGDRLEWRYLDEYEKITIK